MMKKKHAVVTGGAGSIGARLVEKLLSYEPAAIRVLDASEYNLFKLREMVKHDERVRLLLGDIRNPKRVGMAIRGSNIVFHLAAIKHIDIAYYNIEEALEVNIDGTKNIVNTCLEEPSVEKVIFISSDKAASPLGLYGMTKLIGEKIFHWAGEIQNKKAFSIVRFGNVIESSGNVFEIWKSQASRGLPVTITSKEMKRYFWTTRDCVRFIIKAANLCSNGELWVPKMTKYSIHEMAMKKGYSVKYIAPRKDEKIDEILLTYEEQKNAKEKDGYFVYTYIKKE